jgi:hypothetical protein
MGGNLEATILSRLHAGFAGPHGRYVDREGDQSSPGNVWLRLQGRCQHDLYSRRASINRAASSRGDTTDRFPNRANELGAMAP